MVIHKVYGLELDFWAATLLMPRHDEYSSLGNEPYFSNLPSAGVLCFYWAFEITGQGCFFRVVHWDYGLVSL